MTLSAATVEVPARLVSLYGSLEGASLALVSNPSNPQLQKIVTALLQDIQAVWVNRETKR